MGKFTPEAITLSVYNKAADRYGAAWQTDGTGSPVLQYTDADDPGFERAVTVTAHTSESTGTVKNSAVMETIKDSRYLWRVGDSETGEFSETFSFKTLGDKGDLGFYYMADTQDVVNHGTFWHKAFEDARKRYPECDLLVHGGDMVHMSGMRDMWQKMLDTNRDFMTAYPMVPSAGNHDCWECYLEGYHNTFEKHFTLDLTPQDTTYGVYYSCDIGDVHFIVMNYGEPVEYTEDGEPTAQLRWLLDDLSSTDKKWKIVICHNPLFSPGKYGCRPDRNDLALRLRKNGAELFAKEGVDLILSGHDHVYSASYPITGENEVQSDCPFVTETVDGTDAHIFVNPKGPVNFLPGCAGNQDRGIDEACTPEYGKYLFDMLPMVWCCTAYSYITVKGDTLLVHYRMISTETGETKAHRVFGVRKKKSE